MDGAVYAHYETGQYTPTDIYLDDKEYGRALDTIVKGCVDVVVTDNGLGKVLLLKRIIEPQSDWWVLGGRMQAGETPAEAAARNMKREAGLSIEPQRFKFLCVLSLLWQHRREEPADNGCADISLTFTVQLSPEEIEAIAMDRAEYGDACWVDPASIIPDASYHTAVRRVLQHITIRKEEEEVHTAIEAGLPDEDIGKLARIRHRAHKALTDIERKPHKNVRCYGSAQERAVLLKASQAAQSAISINATAAGIGSWVYKTLGY